MGRRINRIAERGGEEGMTLIEVLVAAIILALAALAVFGVLAAATRNAQRGQAMQVALDKAQQQLEMLDSLEYSELALRVLPEHSASPRNPNYRVVDGKYFYVRRDPLGVKAEMIRSGDALYGGGFVEAAGINPGPISFREGNVSGRLYRFIVWRDDPECPENPLEPLEDFCPGNQDYKQVIVAAQLDSGVGESGERGYVEVQSQISNPDALAQRSTRGDNVGGPGSGESEEEQEQREKEEKEDKTGGLTSGKAVTAQQFFLSDTSCSKGGETAREGIAGDHPLHNTLGTCMSGPQAGETLGAPDALLQGAPPDPAPEDESIPAQFDYSNDPWLTPNPDTDVGVQLVPDDTAGCHYKPKSTVRAETKVHRWVTDPMPAGFNFKMNGKVTLEFSSQTLNGFNMPATVCIFLFIRDETGPAESPVATDTLLTTSTGTPYWTESRAGNPPWPQAWQRLRKSMEFAVNANTETVKAGDRLGVALSLDPANTPASIPIMYDHPDFASRLEVDTTTPLAAPTPEEE